MLMQTRKITDLPLKYFLKNGYNILKKLVCLYKIETVLVNFK